MEVAGIAIHAEDRRRIAARIAAHELNDGLFGERAAQLGQNGIEAFGLDSLTVEVSAAAVGTGIENTLGLRRRGHEGHEKRRASNNDTEQTGRQNPPHGKTRALPVGKL